MIDRYSLTINSNNDKARAIATTDDDKKIIIDLIKVKKEEPVNKEVETEPEILPLFHRPPSQNIRIYIAAQSGAGKSYFVAQILVLYHKIYNKQTIYIFSTLDYDEQYDDNPKLKKYIKRINLDVENAEQILSIKEQDLADSICIFDDFLLEEKILRKKVSALKNILMKRGRHYNIDICIINDKVCGGAKTITELNQSNYICVFPFCTNFGEIEYLLTKYAGFDKEQIKRIRELEDDTRWMCFHKIFPKYCVYQHGVLLLTKK